MLIKDVWYVAAHSDELEVGGVLGRSIAGERIVFCRRDDGTVFALEDQCPHRRAPLSMGELIKGVNLRRPY
jgi:phenylpropionate dioxygenase-like ring-hydroxylating dioxygenase large terminal subunit